jgi:hypothetical protein
MSPENSEIRHPSSEIESVSEYERERRLYRAIKIVAGTPEGRETIAWLCDLVDYGATPFDVKATRMAFKCGRQDPVNRLVFMVETPIDTLLAKIDDLEKKNTPAEVSGGLASPAWELYGKRQS